MSKQFIIQIIEILNILSLRAKNKMFDISNKSAATRSFNMLYKLGSDMFGYNFVRKLSDEKIKDASDLKELLLSDDFKDAMMNDRQGKFVIKQIKYPTKADIAKEMKAIQKKYNDQMSEDINDVDNPEHTYAIRTNPYGLAPDLFVEGVKSEEGRREVRKLYAWMYKVNYFKVRECSLDWYKKHQKVDSDNSDIEYNNDDLYKYEDKIAMDEELIESINSVNESFDDDGFRRRGGKRRMIDDMNSRRFNKYRRFDDLEDYDEFDDFEDIYNRNDTDDFYDDLDDDTDQDIFEASENITFAKGDMVQKINSKNEQGFIVIDVLESEADIESAKKKRNYRRMLPKGFEISEDNPALAVMTMKGHRGGLNYIYPASEFEHIG